MIDYDAQHTVYLHRDADGQIIYVGCTVDLEQRTASHRRSATWRNSIASVETDSVQPTWDAGRARERELIRLHEPRHNDRSNPARAREKDAWAASRGVAS